MKYLLSALLLSAACTTPNAYVELTDRIADYGVRKIYDDKTKVVCYIYRDSDAPTMSCVALKKNEE